MVNFFWYNMYFEEILEFFLFIYLKTSEKHEIFGFSFEFERKGGKISTLKENLRL